MTIAGGMTSRLLALILILAAPVGCETDRGETYGFLATLGSDTTSVERVTRTSDRITGDAVGRSPVVVRRRWEISLAPDGSIRRWSMDTHIPNAPAGQSDIHHEGEFTDSVIRLARRTAIDTMNVAYSQRYVTTVPWNAFVYATYELLLDAAAGRPDTTQIGQYFFEGWSEGRIGRALVRQTADRTFSISSTGLAGSGVALVDERGRLVSYSGEGTTYKQEVRRLEDVPDIDEIAARFASREKETGVVRSLSVRDTVRAKIGTVSITIDYGRPLARNRALVGGLIPYNRVWRTGANAATQLTVSAPITLAGIAFGSGTYTLWTLPTEQGVDLIVNRQHGQWGTEYQSGLDAGRARLQVHTTVQHVESFTILVERRNDESAEGSLVMRWGTFEWSAPIGLATVR